MRKTVVGLLRDAGYHCSEAVDGFDAVEKATANAPDLIVLDLRMPKMNGIEAARALKERLPKTKIILLTAYEIGHSLATSVGIDTVIRKSDGAERLVNRARELLAPQAPKTSSPRSDSPPTATGK